MEKEIVTLVLVSAGAACIITAAIHGYLGQTRLIAPTNFGSRQGKALVTVIWQFSSVVWVACGCVIAASPWLFADDARPWAVLMACLPLAWCAIGNAWVTRGRHFGWKILAAIISAAIIGALV